MSASENIPTEIFKRGENNIKKADPERCSSKESRRDGLRGKELFLTLGEEIAGGGRAVGYLYCIPFLRQIGKMGSQYRIFRRSFPLPTIAVFSLPFLPFRFCFSHHAQMTRTASTFVAGVSICDIAMAGEGEVGDGGGSGWGGWVYACLRIRVKN